MRFVELKSQEQLDIQTLHRVRSRLVGARTTLINQLRAILLERGTTVPQGRGKLETAIDTIAAPSGPPSIVGSRFLTESSSSSCELMMQRVD